MQIYGKRFGETKHDEELRIKKLLTGIRKEKILNDGVLREMEFCLRKDRPESDMKVLFQQAHQKILNSIGEFAFNRTVFPALRIMDASPDIRDTIRSWDEYPREFLTYKDRVTRQSNEVSRRISQVLRTREKCCLLSELDKYDLSILRDYIEARRNQKLQSLGLLTDNFAMRALAFLEACMFVIVVISKEPCHRCTVCHVKEPIF
jgi:hypothetical protein